MRIVEAVWGVALGALLLCACGGGGGAETPDAGPPGPPRIAVLSAFPAELAAVLEHTHVDRMQTIDGHIFRTGTIGGKDVVVAMTGIGLANARKGTQAVLDHFDVTGVVFSGVAGSRLNIGDVAVPESWTLTADGSTYAVDADWLALARGLVSSADVTLEDCTTLPTDPSMNVCLPNPPVVAVGGVGKSADPYGNFALPCTSGGNDVFGCDVGGPAATSPGGMQTPDPDPPVASDEETAACAHETIARGLPFIAFRSVSDGMGDPLGLPGFPDEFFTYYRLAAHNAAAAAVPFVTRL